MYPIDDQYAVAAPPAPPTTGNGPVGWFSGLVARAGIPATRIRFWWLNAVQGSLLGLLDGAGLTYSKTDYTLVPQAVAIIGRRRKVFLASGSFIVPLATYRIRVQGPGGGGPGGHGADGGGGGGAAAGSFDAYLAVTPGEVITVNIGAGGVPGTLSGSTVSGAASGGTTSLLSGATLLAQALGGGGGGLGPNGPGSTAFGTATVPAAEPDTVLTPQGESGQNGASTPNLLIGGQGGGSLAYQGGVAQIVASGGNADGNGGQPGCGGGGGAGTGLGGPGGGGLVTIEY